MTDPSDLSLVERVLCAAVMAVVAFSAVTALVLLSPMRQEPSVKPYRAPRPSRRGEGPEEVRP